MNITQKSYLSVAGFALALVIGLALYCLIEGQIAMKYWTVMTFSFNLSASDLTQYKELVEKGGRLEAARIFISRFSFVNYVATTILLAALILGARDLMSGKLATSSKKRA
ncbi:hypothetical protein KBI23_06390 [bacterium]|nr:hypothetical protein [bacterium]